MKGSGVRLLPEPREACRRAAQRELAAARPDCVAARILYGLTKGLGMKGIRLGFVARRHGIRALLAAVTARLARPVLLACVCACVLVVADAAAQSGGARPWEEYHRLVNKQQGIGPLGSDLFGDSVDLATGAVSFAATDVSIAGNHAIPVAVGRKFQVRGREHPSYDRAFGDWDIDIPHVGGVFATTWHDNRCTVAVPPSVPASGFSAYISGQFYWKGNSADMPYGGDMLQIDASAARPSSGTYHWITPGRTVMSCLQHITNGPGQGFLALAPDGTKYWFNHMAQYDEDAFAMPVRTSDGSMREARASRKYNALYATRIEDRFGNWVEYVYSNAYDRPLRVQSISSSDGRRVAFETGDSGRIQSVTTGDASWNHRRTWRYEYAGNSLRYVILPDESRWTIAFQALTEAKLDYMADDSPSWRTCFRLGPLWSSAPVTGTITHPSGATGTFSVQPVVHGRSDVPAVCQNWTTRNAQLPDAGIQNDDNSIIPFLWHAFSLTSKAIHGPGLVAQSWIYEYSTSSSYFFPDGGTTPTCTTTTCLDPVCLDEGCANTKATRVAASDGSWQRYVYGNSYRYNEGKLLLIEQGKGAETLRTTKKGYDLAQVGRPYPLRIGTSPHTHGAGFVSEFPRPQVSNVVVQDGVSFSWLVDWGCHGSGYCFDDLLRPASVTKSMGQWHSKVEATEYYDVAALWVLGQVLRTTTNGIETTRTDYWPNTALPQRTYTYGKMQHYLVHNADGTLASVTDGNSNTVFLSNWKRGIPQTIQHPITQDQPAGATQSASVNDHGWITSIVDENGFATGYGYDAMGRLASIAYPADDSVAWNVTTITFTGGHPAVYGLADGHWRQVKQTGNRREVTFMDALWQPVVKESYDASNVYPTLSQVVSRYDSEGRVVFQSYPQRNLDPAVYNTWADPSQAPNALGTDTVYDALDRVTQVVQDSEHGPLTTSTQYVAPFQTLVTNPRGFQTTTGYYAWDEPTYDLPGWIVKDVGNGNDQATQIQRDVFGKPLQIRQSGYTSGVLVDRARSYVYDAHQRLCKSIEPETVSTVMDYDPAGNLAWTATGHDLPDTSTCNTAQGYGWGRRIERVYDGRNRLKELRFPDQRGNQVWNYAADGLPTQIITYNDPGAQGMVVNQYQYNKRRLLTGESVAPTGSYAWGVGYGYDANGSLANNTYPTGLIVSYAPNALGQPTSVTSHDGWTYASGISYHPNGAIKQFTYGNGLAHSMLQNARQLPNWVMSSGGAQHYEYHYDRNGNPGFIGDHVRGSTYHRSMEYDGLDRMTAAGSASFGGDHWHRLTYDAIDNITSWKLGGLKDFATYYYDAKNHLTNILNSQGSGIVGIGYDPQGNVNNHNGQQYVFDFGNRLREAVGKEWYRYDGHGRRVLNWRTNEPGTLTMYTQSGQLLYDENHRASGRKATENIYLAGSLLSTRARNIDTNAWTVSFHHTDALGSPVATTNTAGQVVDRTAYQPWGRPIAKPDHDGISYTGHVRDSATQLMYMQQRYYDPSIGRFLSVDPVTANPNTGANFNRYWYANNNPYKFTDPDGRISRANTCSRAGGTSCSGSFATNAIEAGWSLAKRISTADSIIRTTERRLESRPGGNSFENFDKAAAFFRRTFAKVGTYLQLEFGAVSEPIVHNIVGIVRSELQDFDRNLVGVGVNVNPVPLGGAEFHTHPSIRHPSPGFSGNDLYSSMNSSGYYSYVFYGYSTYVGKKLDMQAARAAGVGHSDPQIHTFVSDFH